MCILGSMAAVPHMLNHAATCYKALAALQLQPLVTFSYAVPWEWRASFSKSSASTGRFFSNGSYTPAQIHSYKKGE